VVLGVNLADAVNPNTADQYADYNWNDANHDAQVVYPLMVVSYVRRPKP
jgi:hypothetical protein